VRGRWERSKRGVNRIGHFALGSKPVVEIRQFVLGRQVAMKEQERCLFKAAVLGEIVDVVATVLEAASVAVNFADLANASRNAF